MKHLGLTNLFTSHFVMGCVESVETRTQTKTPEIEVLHKWMEFKDSDWGMKQYRTDRTEYISFPQIIELTNLNLIFHDLMAQIYKQQYPFATKEDFIESIFGYTIFDFGHFIERDYTWYGGCPNVKEFDFYYTFERVDSEFIDFVIDADKDIDFYKQYFKKVLELIEGLEFDAAKKKPEIPMTPQQPTTITTPFSKLDLYINWTGMIYYYWINFDTEFYYAISSAGYDSDADYVLRELFDYPDFNEKYLAIHNNYFDRLVKQRSFAQDLISQTEKITDPWSDDYIENIEGLRQFNNVYINSIEDFLKIMNNMISKYSVFIDSIKPTEVLENEKVSLLSVTKNESPTFKNNFDNVTTVEIYKHFKAGLVEKGHLTVQELNEYLKAAFELKTIPETLFKLKQTSTKQKIYTVFYVYYKDISPKEHERQTEYAALLGDYFEGYKTQIIKTNWARDYTKKK